jgi:hypothetical protein
VSSTNTKRRHDRHHRQRIGAHIGKPQRDHQHRAEGGRLRRAEQRRRSQRVAQQALQRRAGQSQDRADRQRQDGARQADFANDHLRYVAAAAEQGVNDRKRRQPHRPDAERDQHQQPDEGGQCGRHADAAARGLVICGPDGLNTHRSPPAALMDGIARSGTADVLMRQKRRSRPVRAAGAA